jgi:hypothetical protein
MLREVPVFASEAFTTLEELSIQCGFGGIASFVSQCESEWLDLNKI